MHMTLEGNKGFRQEDMLMVGYYSPEVVEILPEAIAVPVLDVDRVVEGFDPLRDGYHFLLHHVASCFNMRGSVSIVLP